MTGIDELLAVMRRLRDPEHGCPWDVEQTFATIAPFTIEEAYEVADAIAREDWDGLEGEVGDLLLQVVYYAQMADERGLFDFDRVARGIAAKMIARHPHVFGEDERRDVPGPHHVWEERKAAERLRRAEAGAATRARSPRSRSPSPPSPAPSSSRSAPPASASTGRAPSPSSPSSTRSWPSSRPSASAATRRRSRPSWATSCSPPSTSPATSASTPRRRCARPTSASSAASGGSRRWRPSRGQAVEGLGVEALDALWEEAKAEERGNGA